MPPAISFHSTRGQLQTLDAQPDPVDPDDLMNLPPIFRLVDENDLYRHPDHGEPPAALNACRNATLTTVRSNPSDKNGWRAFSHHITFEVPALVGIVQDDRIAFADPPRDCNDCIHIVGHAPTEHFAALLRIALWPTTAVREDQVPGRRQCDRPVEGVDGESDDRASRNAGSTVLCSTRYGNVMAELTVTDPTITRFVMSLNDSVELVLCVMHMPTRGISSCKRRQPARSLTWLRLRGSFQSHKSDPCHRYAPWRGAIRDAGVTRRDRTRRGSRQVPSDPNGFTGSELLEFFTDGEPTISLSDHYTNHNTRRLDLGETVNLLRSLDYIQRELRGEPCTELA